MVSASARAIRASRCSARCGRARRVAWSRMRVVTSSLITPAWVFGRGARGAGPRPAELDGVLAEVGDQRGGQPLGRRGRPGLSGQERAEVVEGFVAAV